MRSMVKLVAVVALWIMSAGVAVAQTAAIPDRSIEISGHRDASEAAYNNKSIRYIPFEVPEGVSRLTIKMSFESGENKEDKPAVDSGLFDQRGYGFGSPGLRCWQGQNRADMVITGDAATTSRYCMPGTIESGTWNIIQRYLRSSKAGLDYKYTITFSFGDAPVTAVAGLQQGIIEPAAGWYPGDMHMHTVHSDGKKTLEESIEQHEVKGFRFMACTDHNTSAHHYRFTEAAAKHPRTLLISGQEWTTSTGHANAVGLQPGYCLDFRVDAGDGKLPAVIDIAHDMSSLFVINHPFSIKWRYPDAEWEKADAIEVWNGGWTPDDGLAVALWDSKLKQGRRIGAIAGSDTHGGFAANTTVVYARNLSWPAIMEGLRKQHAFLSESPKGPMLIISSDTALPGDTVPADSEGRVSVQVKAFSGRGKTLRLVWSGGEEKVEASSDYFMVDRVLKMGSASKGWYIRAELLKPDGNMSALTNAIYVTPTAQAN